MAITSFISINCCGPTPYFRKVQFPGYDKKMILITELVGSNEGIADAYKAGTEGNKYESTVYQVADVVERGYKKLLMRLK